jgi:t-SNARE complex subunit (syntaxin)
MGKTQTENVTDKIVALLADGRISQAQWRLWIPRRITEHNQMIIANAKNFADGINEVIENEQIGISKELIFDYQTGQYNGQ